MTWAVVCSADLGNGNRDFLWQDDADGAVIYWLMDSTGKQYLGGDFIPGADRAGAQQKGLASWRLAGTFDVGGGKPALVWQNRDDYSLYFWGMDGVTPTGPYGYFPDAMPNTIQGWKLTNIVGSVFNWQKTDGTIGYWLMQPGSTTRLAGVTDASLDPYVITGTEFMPSAVLFADEFDGDILSLYDPSTGLGTWAPTALSGMEWIGPQGGLGWGDEYDVNPKNALGITTFSIANSVLTIPIDLAPAAIQDQIGGRKYITAAIRTIKAFGYGYFEARIQMPAGNGMLPAFWLLPGDESWPPEIDIVEMLGNAPNTLYSTVHSTINFPGSSQVSASPSHYKLGGSSNGPDLTADFHLLGLDRKPGQLTWYLDNAEVFSATTPLDLETRPLYIILSCAVNLWGNNLVDASTKFPALFKIDYVRVYESKP